MELFLTNRKRADLPFQMDFQPEDMPLAVVQRALDVCATASDIPVLLTGNEPFLHPDLEDIFTAFRKRKLNCVAEISGLMPDSAKKLLVEHPCTLFWRLYRPELLAAQDLAEIRANLKELRDARIPMQFLLLADDLDASYDFALEWLEEFQVRSLMVRMPCTATIPERLKLAAWCAEQAPALLKRGYTLTLDCGAMPCLFSDEHFGQLAKISFKRYSCNPHMVVLLDGHLVHCLPMAMLPGPPVTTFKTHADALQFYYDVFRDLQLDNADHKECQSCPSCLVALCTGPSMAAKAQLTLKHYEELKKLLENEESDPEKRKLQLWRMTYMSMKIAFYADAVECLEELRRHDPGDDKVHYWLGCTYWECNRLTEAEDEFRKCARLTKDPRAPLAELHRRLVKNGNAIRARLLYEEIKRIEPPAP